MNTLSEKENIIEFDSTYFFENYPSTEKLIPEMKKDLSIVHFDPKSIQISKTAVKNTIYETSLDYMIFKPQSEILELSSYAGNVVNTRSVTANIAAGNLLEFSIDNQSLHKDITPYTQKSNDITVQMVKNEGDPEFLVDDLLFTSDGAYGVTDKVKIFKMGCNLVKEEQKFNFNYKCSYSRGIQNFDFFKRTIVKMKETETYTVF